MTAFPIHNRIAMETNRLTLREFEPSDADATQLYAGDPEVTRYTSFGPNTPESTAAVLAYWLSEREREPRVEWPIAIQRKEDGVLIGGTGIAKVNWATGEAAFGYVLRRSAWGYGYATEASRAVLAWAFNELALQRLVAHCEEANTPSLVVLKKLGFSEEAPVVLPRVNGEKRRYLTFVLEQS
jgi:[ribosomal protein S5]-alanine N-acetyltransferase